MSNNYLKDQKTAIAKANNQSAYARRSIERGYALPRYHAQLIAELQGYDTGGL